MEPDYAVDRFGNPILDPQGGTVLIDLSNTAQTRRPA